MKERQVFGAILLIPDMHIKNPQAYCSYEAFSKLINIEEKLREKDAEIESLKKACYEIQAEDVRIANSKLDYAYSKIDAIQAENEQLKAEIKDFKKEVLCSGCNDIVLENSFCDVCRWVKEEANASRG